MSSDAKTGPDFGPLDEVLAAWAGPSDASMLIPVLQQVQEKYGYLPQQVLIELGRRTGIPASRLFGVATFYEQFHLVPRGRHTIRCCRGTACHVNGGAEINDVLCRALGVEDGGTTADLRFTLETVACLGTCFLAPVMMVDGNYYGNLTPRKIESILKGYE